MAEHVEAITLDDFIRLYDTEGPFELAEGERIAVQPRVAGQGVVLSNLFARLLNYETSTDSAEIFASLPYVQTDVLNRVYLSRVPDIIGYRSERWAAYISSTPDWEDRPPILVPDLAVKILAPTDHYTDVQAKVEGYLRDGVRMVWVIDPRRRSVTIYEGEQYHTASGDDMLRGGKLLPGFEMRVSELFE